MGTNCYYIQQRLVSLNTKKTISFSVDLCTPASQSSYVAMHCVCCECIVSNFINSRHLRLVFSFFLSLSPSRLFRFYCISVLCVRLLCFVQFMLLIVDKWHKHGGYCVFAVNTCSPIEHSPNECRQTLQMMPLHSLPLPLSPAPLVRLCVCGPHLTDRKFWRRVCGSNAKIMFSFG